MLIVGIYNYMNHYEPEFIISPYIWSMNKIANSVGKDEETLRGALSSQNYLVEI